MAREQDNKRPVIAPTHRYILEPYRGSSSRTKCPNCGQKHSYTRYIDVTTGNYLEDKFGRCNRVEKCGYFVPPTGDDVGNNTLMVSTKDVKLEFRDLEDNVISLINPERVFDSMTLQDKLSLFLVNKFPDKSRVIDVLTAYKVGESDRWGGATVFWQIDRELDVRTGKIMLYNPEGKRVKHPFPHMSWEHAPDKRIIDKAYIDFKLKQVFFGEHLLRKNKDKDVTYRFVESEKTALICAINSKNPDKEVWIGTGGIELINEDRLLPFEGKKLVFYPDKGEKAVTKWTEKLRPFIGVHDITVNTSLEKTNLPEGSDLADLILSKL